MLLSVSEPLFPQKLLRRAPRQIFENPAEIIEIGKATLQRYIGDSGSAIFQHFSSPVDSQQIEGLKNGFAGLLPEYSAAVGRMKSHVGGNLLDGYRFPEVRFQITLDFCHMGILLSLARQLCQTMKQQQKDAFTE